MLLQCALFSCHTAGFFYSYFSEPERLPFFSPYLIMKKNEYHRVIFPIFLSDKGISFFLTYLYTTHVMLYHLSKLKMKDDMTLTIKSYLFGVIGVLISAFIESSPFLSQRMIVFYILLWFRVLIDTCSSVRLFQKFLYSTVVLSVIYIVDEIFSVLFLFLWSYLFYFTTKNNINFNCMFTHL